MLPNSVLDKDIDSLTGDVIYNSEAFVNKIHNILTTPAFTFPFYREFGSRLDLILFKPFNLTTSTLLLITIENSIKRYYPEAEVQVTVLPLDSSTRQYPLSIKINHSKLVEPLIISKRYQSHA